MMLVTVLRIYSPIPESRVWKCLIISFNARKNGELAPAVVSSGKQASNFGLKSNFLLFTCSIVYCRFVINLHRQNKKK